MKLKSLEFVESVENDEKYKVHFVISDFWFKTGVLFPGEETQSSVILVIPTYSFILLIFLSFYFYSFSSF